MGTYIYFFYYQVLQVASVSDLNESENDCELQAPEGKTTNTWSSKFVKSFIFSCIDNNTLTENKS